MRRAPREPSPRGRPRSHLQGEGRSSHAELAPTPECGAPRGPSVPRGACGLLSGEVGRGCCLLRGNPWAAFLGRLGGEEEQRRVPGARRAGRKGFDYPPGQALCGAQHRRSPRRGRQARVRARARVRPRRAWARLSCGDRAAPPAAPASLLSALLGDTLQRRPPALWLNKSISQTGLALQAPAAAVGRGPSGSIPAPPVPAGPAPASPGAPARASQRLCAPLALPSSPSPFLPHVLLCFPRTGAVRVAEETEPFRRKFGPWSTPVPGHRWARLQPVPPSPRRSPRRLPARPPAPALAPALAPAQPRIAVAC